MTSCQNPLWQTRKLATQRSSRKLHVREKVGQRHQRGESRSNSGFTFSTGEGNTRNDKATSRTADTLLGMHRRCFFSVVSVSGSAARATTGQQPSPSVRRCFAVWRVLSSAGFLGTTTHYGDRGCGGDPSDLLFEEVSVANGKEKIK